MRPDIEPIAIGDRARDLESAEGDVVLVVGLREGLEGRIAEGVYVDAIMSTLDGWRSVEDVRDAVALGALDSYFFPESRLRALDPHDVVPRVFWRNYGRLREAERAATTTDTENFPRCPAEDCGSWRIRRKQDKFREQPNSKGGIWKCKNCCNHFSSPDWPDPTGGEDDEEPATTEAET